jgi:hypothetical protein
MKKTNLYKLKVKDYKTGFIRYREMELQKSEYVKMLEKLHKIDSKGYELQDITRIYEVD